MVNIYVIGGGLLGAAAIAAGVWWVAFKKGKRKSSARTSKLATSLRDEKAKGNIILNTIEDGVVFVDEQGTIQLFNPGAANITGWATEADAVIPPSRAHEDPLRNTDRQDVGRSLKRKLKLWRECCGYF